MGFRSHKTRRAGPATLGLVFAAAAIAPLVDDPPVALDSGTNQLLVSIRFIDERTGFAVGGNREKGDSILLGTEDGGQTWTLRPTELRGRLYDVQFPTRKIGYAVGFDAALLKTTDGGKRWRAMQSGQVGWFASVWFVDPLHGFIVGGRAGGGLLLETRDGGEHWIDALDRVPAPRRREQYRDILFLDQEIGFVVGTGGTILKTTDGGKNWASQPSPVDDWLKAIDFVNPNLGFIAGSNSALLRTDDGGTSWRRIELPFREKLNDVKFVSEKIGFLVSMEGRMRATRDGGRSWRLLHDMGGGALTSLSFPGGRAGYAAGERGTILRVPLDGEH